MFLTQSQVRYAEEFIRHGIEFKAMFPQYGDLIDRIITETEFEIEESTLIDECQTLGCEKAALHTLRSGARMLHYCCRCFVRAGFQPEQWHPECKAAYNHRNHASLLTM